MTEISTLAALWLGLALAATLLSIWLRIATALSEIVVGTIAQLVIGAIIGTAYAWHRPDLGEILIGDGRNPAYVSCRCRTRSGRLSRTVEGGRCGWPD